MLRNLVAVLTCLVLTATCCMPVVSPVKSMASGAVALVFTTIDTDEELGQTTTTTTKPFCSGQFISKDTILTAAHCISAYETRFEQTDDTLQINVIVVDDVQDDMEKTPKSQHLTKLKKLDVVHDLATLKVLNPDFTHSYSPIAKTRPLVGDAAFSFSTPRGNYFSYGLCVVSAFRPYVQFQQMETAFMQYSCPSTAPGSSGSSIFNSSGEIEGTLSLSTGVSTVILATDVYDIQRFLK